MKIYDYLCEHQPVLDILKNDRGVVKGAYQAVLFSNVDVCEPHCAYLEYRASVLLYSI